MDKKTYFIVATAATLGAVAGAFGDDIVTSQALAGANETRDYDFSTRTIPAQVLNPIRTYISNQVCPQVTSRYGDVCNPNTVNFRVEIVRRENGNSKFAGKLLNLPVFVTERPPAVDEGAGGAGGGGG